MMCAITTGPDSTSVLCRETHVVGESNTKHEGVPEAGSFRGVCLPFRKARKLPESKHITTTGDDRDRAMLWRRQKKSKEGRIKKKKQSCQKRCRSMLWWGSEEGE